MFCLCAKAIKQNPDAKQYIKIDMELVDNYIYDKQLRKNNIDYDKIIDEYLSTITIEI